MKSVKELEGLVDAKRSEIAKIYEGKATSVDGEARYNLSVKEVEDVRDLNKQLNGLSEELEKAREVDEIFIKNQEAIRRANTPGSQLPLGGGKGAVFGAEAKVAKSLGQMFVESDEYKNRKNAKNIDVEIKDFDYLEQKTLMETGAGYAPQAIRTGKVVPFAHRRVVIADLIPQSPTDQSAIVYMEETTSTNGAATRAEGGSAGESALVYTQRTDPVVEIATFIPVTEIQVEDVDGVQSLIDNRLLNFLDLVEEVQLLTGDGNAPNMTGFLTKSGVQSQAKGSDPVADAIYKSITLVRFTGMAEPTGIAMHPNDWQDVRLTRTTEGIYLWGNPSEAGPERMWGLPIVPTTAQTENTALVGDFQLYSEIKRKRGARVKVSDSHSDFFIKGKLAIKADKRAALAIYRAAAFCKVTGI